MNQESYDPAQIERNLSKAEESLVAAQELLDNGHPGSAASRAYFAAFYAATAALLELGFSFSTHRGVIGAVHRHFVKTGKLSTEAGEAISALFDTRLDGDYGTDKRSPEPEDADEAIDRARRFVSEIKALLK